jgi:hypothetical protein
LNDSASLTLGTPSANLRFDWLEYDGDDCFAQHVITYSGRDGTKTFNLGACATRCIRKIESLLNAETESVGFGFRVPEIIYYDIDRTDDSLKLHVYSDELGLDAEMQVALTEVAFDMPFRRYYDRK